MKDLMIVNPNTNELDLMDGIQHRLLQLQAMAVTMIGDGDFEELAPEIKNKYYWAMNEKISETNMLFDRYIEDARRAIN